MEEKLESSEKDIIKSSIKKEENEQWIVYSEKIKLKNGTKKVKNATRFKCSNDLYKAGEFLVNFTSKKRNDVWFFDSSSNDSSWFVLLESKYKLQQEEKH